MRQLKAHPWSLLGQFVTHPERSRSRQFTEYLETRPAEEVRAIKAAEAAYLGRLVDERTVPGAAERDFQDAMHVVREGDPVHVFTA